MMNKTILCVVAVVCAAGLLLASESRIGKQAVVLSGDIFSLSQNACHDAKSNQLIPASRQDDSLWYGTLVYSVAIGLTAGGTFEFAIRLTPTELGPYTGWNISGIKFHKYSGDLNNVVKVYDNGTPTQPGPMITSEPYASSAPDEWVTVMLSSPVLIPGTGDLWCSIEVTHNAGEYPASADAGPAVYGKGNWIYSNNAWNNPFDLNWLIIAYLEDESSIEEEKPITYPPHLQLLQNPMKGNHIELLLTSPESNEVEITLYNQIGQKLRTYQFNGLKPSENRLSLEAEGLPAGIYFLKLNGKPVGKVVKVR